MSLKAKVGLLIAALFLVSGAASVAVDRWVIRPSFLELERAEAERNTGRAVESIHHELDVLSTNVNAWAWRDDVQRFMQGQDDAFVRRALGAESVASAAVSYLGFYRVTGEQLVHRAPGDSGAGLGRLQDASLRAEHPLLQHADPRGATTGLVSTPSGPMLVASRPILGPGGAGPPSGVLIFGRLLDAQTVARIAEQNRLELRVEPATSADPSAPPAGPPSDWEPGQPRRATAVRVDPAGVNLIGQTSVADLHGEPVLTLTVTTPRTISARGEEASRIALATLGAVGVVVLAVLVVLVHVTVLGPIGKFTKHALNVGQNDALNDRLRLVRRDELGVLATEFDRMTDRLAEARERLIDQSFVSGKADMAAGILHNLGNAVTPIAVRLHLLRDRLKAAPLDDLERAAEELEAGAAAPERRADLARFVELASLELIALLRGMSDGVESASGQIEHVQQILTEQSRYSRVGGVAERVDLERLVRAVADGLSPELRAAITVSIEPSVSAQGHARGPRVTLQQIIGNLLLNAAESIRSQRSAGGRVTVRAVRETAGQLALGHLTFEDDGAGIAAADLARIFERRFSTKQRGTGLGLHWSANAVVALGGRLYAESPGVGRGATLHLLLPLAEVASGAPDSIDR
jgi:two-component system, NtrC family, sensor kinase